MGFLTILNFFAMGVGYIILLLGLIIVVWLIVSSIKEKIEMKKWEKERVEEDEKQKILDKEKEQTSESATTHISTPTPSENNKEPNENKEENKEKLVDDSGNLKMVG